MRACEEAYSFALDVIECKDSTIPEASRSHREKWLVYLEAATFLFWLHTISQPVCPSVTLISGSRHGLPKPSCEVGLRTATPVSIASNISLEELSLLKKGPVSHR